MYLLCAKSPQGPPIAPGQSPLFRTTLDDLPSESKVAQLRSDVAKLLQMELNSFNLLYCGRILDDERTIESYKIKSTSSVHVIPKAPKQEVEETEERKAVTDEELQQFMIAFGMAVKNPAFNRVAQGLAKRENLEMLIAANPSLAKDPIACGFLSLWKMINFCYPIRSSQINFELIYRNIIYKQHSNSENNTFLISHI